MLISRAAEGAASVANTWTPPGTITPPGTPSTTGTSGLSPAGPTAGRSSPLKAWFERWSTFDSVAKLRLARLLLCLGLVVFAIVGLLVANGRQAAHDDVKRAANQLLVIQQIQFHVTRADAAGAVGYLQGGSETAETRTAFDTSLSEALRLVSRLETDTAVDLSSGTDSVSTREQRIQSIATDLGVYARLSESARANNRQGFPVGAAYQRQAAQIASSPLDDTNVGSIMFRLKGLEADERDRLAAAAAAAHSGRSVIAVLVVVALAAVGGVSWWLARRSRRTLNAGLAGAAGLLLAVWSWSSTTIGQADQRLADTVGTVLHEADLVGQISVAANEARTSEAFSLIQRGNGDASAIRFENVIRRATLAANEYGDRDVDAPLVGAIGAYQARYGAATGEARDSTVRGLDRRGDWDEAVAKVLNERDVEGTFADVASLLDVERDRTTARFVADIGDASRGLATTLVLVPLGFLAAAIAVAVGIGRRLAEYR
jgi:CHASE3 domain sensor protein